MAALRCASAPSRSRRRRASVDGRPPVLVVHHCNVVLEDATMQRGRSRCVCVVGWVGLLPCHHLHVIAEHPGGPSPRCLLHPARRVILCYTLASGTEPTQQREAGTKQHRNQPSSAIQEQSNTTTAHIKERQHHCTDPHKDRIRSENASCHSTIWSTPRQPTECTVER